MEKQIIKVPQGKDVSILRQGDKVIIDFVKVFSRGHFIVIEENGARGDLEEKNVTVAIVAADYTEGDERLETIVSCSDEEGLLTEQGFSIHYWDEVRGATEEERRQLLYEIGKRSMHWDADKLKLEDIDKGLKRGDVVMLKEGIHSNLVEFDSGVKFTKKMNKMRGELLTVYEVFDSNIIVSFSNNLYLLRKDWVKFAETPTPSAEDADDIINYDISDVKESADKHHPRDYENKEFKGESKAEEEFKMALSLCGLQVSESNAELILMVSERFMKLGSKFSIDDAADILYEYENRSDDE